MPCAAVIGAALQGSGTRPRALWMGGLDILGQPGATQGQGYGVDPTTIRVTERGAGGISSCDFEIDDPGSQVVVQEGMPVLFWDLTNDVPIFAGWVDHYSARIDFGNLSRSYS